ncbi:MAG: transcriptional regulator, family [Candidatus Solibacter sp.]|jgi:transcriptional regulator with XRE-family HTH domain|nr:transcriptional regulator, family [Candidatus Solibacter sp.]
MTFEALRARLVENLRLRVRSGEATERGLARITGISQPHLHHVLKGKRLLSFERADEVLRRLDMDLLELVSSDEFAARPLSPLK